MTFANGDMLKAGLSWIKNNAGTLTLNIGVPLTYEDAINTVIASAKVGSGNFRGPVYTDPQAVIDNPLEGSDCALYIDELVLAAVAAGEVSSFCILKATEPELIYSSSIEEMVITKICYILLKDVCIKSLQPTEECGLPDEYLEY